jgi:hypothetical protein
MKSLLERTTREEILARLETFTPETQRLWGTMDVAQTLAHCASALDMATGRLNPKRTFIGRIIGPLFRANYSNEKPFGKSSPTSDELVIRESRDFNREKEHLRELINSFCEGGLAGITDRPHPFFGPLTKEEWAIGMYKHLDHHFRQFGK